MSGRRLSIKIECSVPEWDGEKNDWKFPFKKANIAFKTKEVCHIAKDATDEQLDALAIELAVDIKKDIFSRGKDFLPSLLRNLLRQLRVIERGKFDEFYEKQEETKR